MKTAASCVRCTHYFVTWDPKFPYGCRAMGFKAEKNPALVVFESSGAECQLFQAKQPKPPSRTAE